MPRPGTTRGGMLTSCRGTGVRASFFFALYASRSALFDPSKNLIIVQRSKRWECNLIHHALRGGIIIRTYDELKNHLLLYVYTPY